MRVEEIRRWIHQQVTLGGLGCKRKEIRQITGDWNGRRSRVPNGRRHVRCDDIGFRFGFTMYPVQHSTFMNYSTMVYARLMYAL